MNEHEERKALGSMTAADVMTASPRTCSTFSTVLEVVMIFRDTDCGAVPILAEGKPVAILTDRDVALAIGEFPDLVSRPVSDIMTPGVVAVAPDDSLGDVCEVLRSQGVRRVLVVDPIMQVLGIIGWADIAPVLSDRTMGQVVKDVVIPSVERCAKHRTNPGRELEISRIRARERFVTLAAQRFKGQRPLCRRIVRSQFIFRANSSLASGKPNGFLTQPTAGDHDACAGDHDRRRARAQERIAPFHPQLRDQKLGDAHHHHRQAGNGQNRTGHEQCSAVFRGIEVLAYLDRGQTGLKLGQCEQILAEARDAVHHAGRAGINDIRGRRPRRAGTGLAPRHRWPWDR